MASATAGWEKAGDRFYRKVKLYETAFDADLELEDYLVVGAPYSGAIAFYRENTRLQTYRAGQSRQSSINIYSCSGNLISELKWDLGAIRGIGWSQDENLIVVASDGTVRFFTSLFGDFTEFSLGHGSEDLQVKECRFWPTGFVAMLSNNQLVSVSQYIEPRPRLLAKPPDGAIYSWAIIPPGQSLSRSVEVLLSVDQTIFVVDSTSVEDRSLEEGPFGHMAVSPNGNLVTLYTDAGKVWVISSDFQNKLSEYETKSKTMPKSLSWCGNNGVVLAWEDEVHLVAPSGNAIKYYYDSFVQILPDVDSVRVLTNGICDMLQRVPDETEEAFRLGSTAPAAVLLDAVDALDKKSPKADDNIQLIRNRLEEAVNACISAAGQEFDHHWQRQLMKAASFGKNVLDLFNPDSFVEMCEALRVLNAVRDYRIGIPITYNQLSALTSKKLIHRLVERREYLLALKISEYLHLSTDKIYVHWASQKARSASTNEQEAAQIIIERLSGKKGVSFEVIAKAAYDEGRTKLAVQLLDHETRPSKQVPLLLSMEEDEVALDKAVASGDTDLVLFVLMKLRSKVPLASFFRILFSRPVALALVESSAAANDESLLRDLYYQDDQVISSSLLHFSIALRQTDVPSSQDKIALAARALGDSKDPASVFQHKALNEATQLLKVQDQLSKELDTNYVGFSIHKTLLSLVSTGYLKRATALASSFHVSEKQFGYIRLRGLVAARNWTELEELSKARKSVIPWQAYYTAVLEAGNPRLAGSFVAKCTSLTGKERAEMYVRCGNVPDAVKELVKVKDLAGIEELRGKGDRMADIEVERGITQLSGRR